jgi:hypothetical protein
MSSRTRRDVAYSAGVFARLPAFPENRHGEGLRVGAGRHPAAMARSGSLSDFTN